MLVNFFCYISFFGFVNVKGKGLVRLREGIKKIPNFGHCPNMEGGVSGVAKLRAVNFKFWMGVGGWCQRRFWTMSKVWYFFYGFPYSNFR